MAEKYVPGRGDLVWLQFTPQAGPEQAGRRPAFVVSPKIYNQKVGLALFCPVTSQVKGYPFEVVLPPEVGISGVVLSDQVKSLDWRERKVSLLRTLPKDIIDEVLGKLSTLIP